MMRFVKSGLGVSAAAAVLAFGAGEAFAQSKEIVFGFQCDRTGPTATVGTVLCPGYHDYIALIIFFLVVEPDGLNRLWRNIRNYFRIWPFAY